LLIGLAEYFVLYNTERPRIQTLSNRAPDASLEALNELPLQSKELRKLLRK
jgi:hypothetical protein